MELDPTAQGPMCVPAAAMECCASPHSVRGQWPRERFLEEDSDGAVSNLTRGRSREGEGDEGDDDSPSRSRDNSEEDMQAALARWREKRIQGSGKKGSVLQVLKNSTSKILFDFDEEYKSAGGGYGSLRTDTIITMEPDELHKRVSSPMASKPLQALKNLNSIEMLKKPRFGKGTEPELTKPQVEELGGDKESRPDLSKPARSKKLGKSQGVKADATPASQSPRTMKVLNMEQQRLQPSLSPRTMRALDMEQPRSQPSAVKRETTQENVSKMSSMSSRRSSKMTSNESEEIHRTSSRPMSANLSSSTTSVTGRRKPLSMRINSLRTGLRNMVSSDGSDFAEGSNRYEVCSNGEAAPATGVNEERAEKKSPRMSSIRRTPLARNWSLRSIRGQQER